MNPDNDTRKWEVLKSDYLFRQPWLTVRRDHVRLPTGTEIPDYYVLEYPTWVNITAITPEGQMLLVRQYRHGLQWTGYELCAGVVDPGETPIEAARRELLEETGYAGGQWTELTVLSPNPTSCTNLCHCFVAEGVTKVAEPSQEATEDITSHLFSPAEVMEMLCDDLIKQSLMSAALWKYFHTRHDASKTTPPQD
ncbi:MAG: NUDIX hydrolase [Muribaculaceae bacterium]|nr:NUDIX hydrolase [Muribaculaceae bacterium]